MDEIKMMQLLDRMGVHQVAEVTQFRNQEDGGAYDVWRIEVPDKSYVLKRAKAFERETYEGFFASPTAYAPQLMAVSELDGTEYLLLEYVPGQDLMHCTRDALIRTLDSLAQMQIEWWGNLEKADVGQSFARSLEGRKNRLRYLGDPILEAVFQKYLDAYCSAPKTLCHDDLLPFNVQASDDRAVFIDWEYGGILPYLTSLARLIAHGEEREDAFFWMTEADKHFAMDYYYEKCAKLMGITKEEYRIAVNLFLFYEYCEWIYVGNKFGNTDNERYRKYLKLARELAEIVNKR